MISLVNKRTVLISGASKGIGLAISQRLAAKGYQVIGIARNNPDITYPGIFFACDLNNGEETNTVLKSIREKHSVDIIINNVGITLPQPLGKIDLTSLHNVYDLNVRTTVQITQMFIDMMINKHWGRIINISSRAIFGVKNRSSYAAAKCALIGLTKTWALELAESGVTVNAVAPGPTETALFRQARPIGSAAEKETLANIPMNRFGKPDEIAAGIEFLISDDAGFITGQTLCIDGGASL